MQATAAREPAGLDEPSGQVWHEEELVKLLNVPEEHEEQLPPAGPEYPGKHKQSDEDLLAIALEAPV